MNETITQDQWSEKQLTPAQRENRALAENIPVASSGVAPQNFAQAVDYAKFMSLAHGVVGPHLVGNVGACLAVMEMARQFDMPYYAVARQTYLVNGRVAFMGQIIHAIINKSCPLKRKLSWTYRGEGQNLQIIISGEFKDESEPRIWESPKLSEIKVKNSPLWHTNPKHQFVYFGVRAWQTIHWPEGLLGIYTDDEAASLPRETGAANARDITPEKPSLATRLMEARAGDDGFTNGHTESQIDEMRNGHKEAEPERSEPASSEGEEINHATDGPAEGAELPFDGTAVEDQTTEEPAQTGTAASADTDQSESPAQVMPSSAFVQLTLSAINACTSKTALKEIWASSKPGRATLTDAEEAELTAAKAAREQSLTKGAK